MVTKSLIPELMEVVYSKNIVGCSKKYQSFSWIATVGTVGKFHSFSWGFKTNSVYCDVVSKIDFKKYFLI